MISDIICDRRCGFKTDAATLLARIKFMQERTTAREMKENATGLFLDLKKQNQKASDTAEHDLLWWKTWQTSCLEGRTQYVQINNVKSQVLNVKRGVPQGSVPGSLLFFILWTNNGCAVSKSILFADDAYLLRCGENLEQPLDTVGDEVEKVESCFDTNKPTINFQRKTRRILIEFKRIFEKTVLSR